MSTGDLYSICMGLESLFTRNSSLMAAFYTGKVFLDIASYTYHLHSLIGISYLYHFSGDQSGLAGYWDQYV